MSTFEADRNAVLPPASRPGAVTLRVADPAGVTPFYRDVLGLAVRQADEAAVELGTPSETLVRLLPGGDARTSPRTPGLYHLALLLPDRASLGAWLRHAVESGTPLQGAADHAVSEAVYLADPEGNGVEIYRDRPREEWRLERGQVHMVTEPLDAAASSSWTGAPAATAVGHVHLQVADLGRARAFYEGVLRLPVTNDGFPGAVFLGAGGYHHHLGLNTWGVSAGSTRRNGEAGIAWFELLVPAEADVAALAARVSAAGSEATRYGGTLRLADPAGIEVRVAVEPRAG